MGSRLLLPQFLRGPFPTGVQPPSHRLLSRFPSSAPSLASFTPTCTADTPPFRSFLPSPRAGAHSQHTPYLRSSPPPLCPQIPGPPSYLPPSSPLTRPLPHPSPPSLPSRAHPSSRPPYHAPPLTRAPHTHPRLPARTHLSHAHRSSHTHPPFPHTPLLAHAPPLTHALLTHTHARTSPYTRTPHARSPPPLLTHVPRSSHAHPFSHPPPHTRTLPPLTRRTALPARSARAKVVAEAAASSRYLGPGAPKTRPPQAGAAR